MPENNTPINRPLEQPRRAIVVGASSGLGAALARRLAARGYRVAAVARREAELARAARQRRPRPHLPLRPRRDRV